MTMHRAYIEDEVFTREDFTQQALPTGEYAYCTFTGCNFSQSNLAEVQFLECEFLDCNLSLANLMKTTLQDITFKDSKMLGLRFDTCNDFALAVSFDSCILNHSSFFRTKLAKTIFNDCKLIETDFTECDLQKSVFTNCDLAGAMFERTNMEGVDFRTSFNYSFDPEVNRIKKAKFSLPGVTGLLDKYGIIIE